MFDEVTNEVLFIHGPDPSVTSKNAEVLNKAFNDYKSTKLMIIAHPDDELIFGGVELIYYGEDYKVVCVTNPKNKDRVLEFEKVMKRLKICSWEMLDYKDTLYPTQTYYKLDDIINSRKWDKIVTHNPVGEYGHPQHKLIHDRVKSLTSDFYVFGKSPIKIEKIILDIKLELLKLYKSGEDIVNMLLNNNGKWFTSKDPTTNYVEYESISKYNIKQDNTSYIHCYDK